MCQFVRSGSNSSKAGYLKFLGLGTLPASLEILNPSPVQDKDSVTVTQAFATRHHLSSIAQLKPLAASMVFGAPPSSIPEPTDRPG